MSVRFTQELIDLAWIEIPIRDLLAVWDQRNPHDGLGTLADLEPHIETLRQRINQR